MRWPIIIAIFSARMGFASEVEAMRGAWKSGGFHAARKLVSDRMFASLPLVAATSAPQVVEQIKPYVEAGATRVILALCRGFR